MTKKVVVDSGPLIILSRTGYLPILEKLFKVVRIPAEVYAEVVGEGKGRPGAKEVADAKWIKVRNVSDLRSLDILSHELGRGEAAAIVLSMELDADVLLMDDKIAREVAKSLGLHVAGTLAVIHEALRRKLIAAKSFESIITELKENGFWISDEIAESFGKN